ncbi:hypothetical protein diail_10816 [Diaporthe ilicicola]|nr:hypothetical protein diail_10816 [Diaporthe ilicicola]
MPPKKIGGTPSEGIDGTAAGAVIALCHLIMSCDEFKPDTAKLAPILGIAQAKNVPRKINSFVNPYGFEFKSGKIVAKAGSQAQAGAAGPSTNSSAAEDAKDGKAPVKAKPRASKKRKLGVSFDDDGPAPTSPPFYDAVKNGMGGAMCGMNKADLGFPGIVQADISAQKTGINAAHAGMDLSPSSYWSNDTLGVGLTNGSFTSERLDDMAMRNLVGYYHLNQDQGYPTLASKTEHRDVRGNHSALARKYASESIVLLKNTNSALPLSTKTSISIFGTHAAPRYVGANTALSLHDGEPSTMQGHMTTRAATDDFMLRWWLKDAVSDTMSSGMMGSGTELTETTAGGADDSDACVIFISAWGGEGADRTELHDADQDALVNTVADNCNNTVVVVNTVGPRLVDAWIKHENVTGVLYAGALGRLVHTIAKNESDYNPDTIISDIELELNSTDGNFIDYKYFDQYNITPRYEFGYGLSHATFDYSSTVSVDSGNVTSGYATGDKAVGGREDLWDIVATAKTSISNTVSLRGLEKVTTQPGESADVTFNIRRRDLSVWSVAGQEWKVVKGEYKLYIGASSRDFKATTTLTVS